MLLGSYETENEKYSDDSDGLGFSFRRTLKRVRRRVKRLPSARIARRFRSRRLRRIFGRALPILRSRRARRYFSNRAKFLTRKIASTPQRMIPVKRRSPGRRQFLKWLKRVDSNLFRQVMSRLNNSRRMRGRTISGLDLEGLDLEQTGMGGLWDDIKGTVTDLLQTGATIAQQRDLYKLQLARAEKGLPPLPAESVAPMIKTQIEIGPETRGQLFSEIGAGMQKYMLPLAIGAGALFFFRKK